MKIRSIALLAVVGILLSAAAVYAAVDLTDVTCPISGKPAKAGTGVDHNGGKVFFCCKNCPKAFAKESDKFAAKANAQLAKTGQATQKGCPISGGKMKDGTEATVAGVSIKFCCNKCQGKVNGASDDDKLNLVFSNAAFKKGFEIKKAE